jgi:hypothetical protein
MVFEDNFIKMEVQSNIFCDDQSQSQEFVFSLGTFTKPPITSNERRKTRITKQMKNDVFVQESIKKKRKLQLKKKLQKRYGKQPNFPPWFQKYWKEITEKDFLKTPIFNIFPTNTFSNGSLLSLCIPSVEQQEWILQTWNHTPFGKPNDWTGSSFWSEEIIQELKKNIFNCQRLRGIFRRFLSRWRLSRFNKANEEDLFTCEVPKYPVEIVDWSSKQKWVFEGQSLMKDITNRLLHHDGCFEDPLAPRNPYTNLPLTAAQTISVYSQLMRYPVSASFAFTAYRASRLHLNSFRYEHRIYLSIHALRKTFDDIFFYETREKMLDFIEMAFDRQGAEVNIEAYEFVIKKFPLTEQIQKWKHLSEKYYELEIKYADFDTARAKAHDKLFVQTFPLLHQQEEIINLYVHHTNRRQTVHVALAEIFESASNINIMASDEIFIQHFLSTLHE